MNKLLNKFSSGDTLIEVLIAVSVFSIVVVGGISVMNMGAAISQRSLEITLVRQEIDAQAEALRLLNAAYISEYAIGKPDASYSTISQQWKDISDKIPSTNLVDDFGLRDKKKCSDIIPYDSGFIINTRDLARTYLKNTDTINSSATYAKINYNKTNISAIDSVDGLWIVAVKGGEEDASSSSRYFDFHIRACWDSIGQSLPATIGTIVRLYEPRD